MAGRKAVPGRGITLAQPPSVKDTETQRAIDTLTTAVQNIQTQRNRDLVVADLVVGTNKIVHGLGRPCEGYSLTPKVANLAFGHALNTSNTVPELEVWIDVVGSSSDGARIEIY